MPEASRSESLLDIIDSLIDKGVALDAEVVLGLADVDLLYLRAGALLAAADRVLRAGPRSRRSRRTAPQAVIRASGGPSSSTPAARAGPADAGRFGGSEDPPLQAIPKVGGSQPASSRADETSRSVIRLVLTLVEFIRQLLERQAVRRVREKTLTADEVERLGRALMQLEATVHELAERHGLDPADLNLDLGPLGTLR
jgi:hypothetical protein